MPALVHHEADERNCNTVDAQPGQLLHYRHDGCGRWLHIFDTYLHVSVPGHRAAGTLQHSLHSTLLRAHASPVLDGHLVCSSRGESSSRATTSINSCNS